MKRGDIYYIEINDEGVTGHEMMKNRPGIIVSRDEHNDVAETVQVVYCSASSKHPELPEHICIRSTPRMSVAMCEHIYTVDKSRLGNYVGSLTEQELQMLDVGIMVALGIGGTPEPENMGGGVLLRRQRSSGNWSAPAASWRRSRPCTSGCLTE